jgi:hypothetical protein
VKVLAVPAPAGSSSATAATADVASATTAGAATTANVTAATSTYGASAANVTSSDNAARMTHRTAAIVAISALTCHVTVGAVST